VRAPVVALAFVVAASGCFPDSARHRRYANIAEGGALVGGIALQYLAKSNDCMERRPGAVVMDCDRSVGRVDTLGLLLIFAGLVGFAATTISGHDNFREADDDVPPRPPETTLGAFCPAIWAGNVQMAEAAMVTYLRSVGAVSATTASDALHAWLSRQACVAVEEEADAKDPRIVIGVTERAQRFSIEISTSPFVVLRPL
jgi:hypothetical protein